MSTAWSRPELDTSDETRVRPGFRPGLIRRIELFDDGVSVIGCEMYWTETTCSPAGIALVAPGSELVMKSTLPFLPGMGANASRVKFAFTIGP